MIPADLASRLKLVVSEQPNAPQPAAPVKNVSDVLSNLVPGQRLMAEIQALLPNGSYRALVAQREIILGLPFAAKQGDSLELEVVENDGKVALAVVGNQAGKTAESVSTTLSQTGKLIGDLMSGIENQGKRAAPAPLNGNLPLVESFPDHAADLASVLKDAVTRSGVFYEAHQARWVSGELPIDALRQEPQGNTPTKVAVVMPAHPSLAGVPETGATAVSPAPDNTVSTSRSEQGAQSNSTPREPNPIPRELTPIVQQQLDGLASQNYAWQGQIWPGQDLRWEISENPDDSSASGNEPAARWQSRLKLSLPSLGGIDATLRLHPEGKVDIALTATSATSEARLRENIPAFRSQLESAGLNLTQLLIQHGESE